MDIFSTIGAGNELNGLTLGGVGSHTTIDKIEVVGNLDDGIEFFGGTVDASNLLVWAQGDDAFDIDQAYSGTISNIAYISGLDSDHGMEIDGPEGASNATGKFNPLPRYKKSLAFLYFMAIFLISFSCLKIYLILFTDSL